MDHQGLRRGVRLSHLVPVAGWAGGAPPPDHLGRAAHGRAGACGATAVPNAVLVGGGCRAPPASRADPERGVQEKRRDSYVRRECQVQLAGPGTKRKDVKLPGAIQSPISNAMRKVDKGTQDVPNNRKVTHDEYEVETANGRITKRRKTTKSTVMTGEPNTQKSLHNTTEKDVTRTRKEEKQRALLQLQWKVMGKNQQVDQEVISKKRRDSYVRKESQVQLAGPETKRKVTHHEYEVETANGRITKRRKTTKSTVMFGEPNTKKSLHNTAEKDVTRTRKAVPGSCPHPANIGELFSEGYAEDPYAFG